MKPGKGILTERLWESTASNGNVQAVHSCIIMSGFNTNDSDASCAGASRYNYRHFK